MAEFSFRGRDNSGKLIQGIRDGNSIDHIASQLISENIIPIDIALAKKKSASGWASLTLALKMKRITSSELIMFCRQMASLYKAGIPITVAIEKLSESVDNKYFAETLLGIANRLISGRTLSNAMQDFPQIFPPFIVKLMRIGEESAHLDAVFILVADYLELQDSNIKRMKSVFRYPIFVLTAIGIGILVINLFVIPAFSKLYGSFKADLPLPTKILITTSNFMVNNWYYLLIIIIGLFFAIRYYLQTLAGKQFWHKHQLNLPIIGNILRRVMLTRVIRTLVITVRGDIPIIDGLNLIANSVTNVYVQKCLFTMKTSLENGEPLSTAANRSGLFTPLILQMFAVGEQTGNIDHLLLEVNRFYEQEIDYDIKTLSTRLEPVLLIAMAIMVLILALGVFLPMWNIAQFAH